MLAFRLALALGRTVAELMRTVSAEEWVYWLAYASLEPFGELRADMRMARICATVAGCSGAKVKEADFMLHFGEKKESSWADVTAYFKELSSVAKPR